MIYLYGLAVLAGIASAVEPGQNAVLAESLRKPLFAGLVTSFVSLMTVVIAMLITSRYGLPGLDAIARVPWWAWWGGLLSAGLALAQLYVSKQIGAAPFIGIIVTAGVATSIVLDHFGLVGFTVHAAGPARLLGGGLMIAGVALIAVF